MSRAYVRVPGHSIAIVFSQMLNCPKRSWLRSNRHPHDNGGTNDLCQTYNHCKTYNYCQTHHHKGPGYYFPSSDNDVAGSGDNDAGSGHNNEASTDDNAEAHHYKAAQDACP